MLRRLICTLPMVGVLAALLAYFHAAALYSDATSLDPAKGGYHHLTNYWCDLLDAVTYTRQANAGRLWGLAATGALIGTLLSFWFAVTSLFVGQRRLAWTVRVAGSVAALAAGLVFTPLHDYVIVLATPLGFVAVLGSCAGLARQREWRLLALGLFAVGVTIGDYLIWVLHLIPPLQPLIEKLAFVFLFLWVVVVALRVLLLPQAAPAPAAVEDSNAAAR